MMTNTHEIDDEMQLISHYCPPIHTHLAPPAAAGKPGRRRRIKKMKGGENSSGMRKRKLNEEQVKCLEQSFENEHKLESEKKDRLASELGLDPRQVAIWFQNKRARWKSKNLEEEYFKLKSQHDSNLIHKCQLETQVLQLKEQVSQAEKEIERLLEKGDGNANAGAGSTISMELMQPSFFGDFVVDDGSAISMELMQPPFFEDFAMDGLENVFYLPQNNYIQGFEWVNTSTMYI